MKGEQEEEKVPPAVDLAIVGGRNTIPIDGVDAWLKPLRRFRKEAYSRLVVTQRNWLGDGCWAHCENAGNIVPSSPL